MMSRTFHSLQGPVATTCASSQEQTYQGLTDSSNGGLCRISTVHNVQRPMLRRRRSVRRGSHQPGAVENDLDQTIARLISQHGFAAVEDSVRRQQDASRRSTLDDLRRNEKNDKDNDDTSLGYAWGRSSTFSKMSIFDSSMSLSQSRGDGASPAASASAWRKAISSKIKKASIVLKKSRDMLRKSERIRRAIFDASFDPIFCIDGLGTILMVNEAAVLLFECDKDEFIGQNFSCIIGGGTNEFQGHSDYIQSFLRRGSDVSECCTKTWGEREMLARRRDGSEFPIEFALSQIKTQSSEERMFCGFVRDMTKQKLFEYELKRKHDISLGIIEAALDPMFTISDDGKISMANQAAVEKFGWSHEELIGQSLSLILAGGQAGKHDAYIRNYLKTGEMRYLGKRTELSARKKDGTEFPIEISITQVRMQSGDERMFCGFIRDMTRQKMDEQELKRKHEITVGIIEASFDAMFAFNDKGVIQMMNQEASKQFGWSREDIMGKSITMIVDSDHADKPDKYIQSYLTTYAKRMVGGQKEVQARRKDGSRFPVMLGLSEIVGQGSSHLYVAFIRNLTDEKKMMAMEIEKAAADSLLFNVLPENIALRLKDDPSHIADHYNNTTILFADIVGFTRLSSEISPAETVSLLNDLFSRFDRLVDKFDLNKVKTIGDCYMVTSVPDAEHQEEGCQRVCHFALDLVDDVEQFNRDHPGRKLNVRVGINSGPVVAGVVGTKRFMYDLWGDAVNIASRMESTGIPGKIQVTKDVVEFVTEDEFEFERRGAVPVKGKGEMVTFMLTRRSRSPVVPPTRQQRSSLTKAI